MKKTLFSILGSMIIGFAAAQQTDTTNIQQSQPAQQKIQRQNSQQYRPNEGQSDVNPATRPQQGDTYRTQPGTPADTTVNPNDTTDLQYRPGSSVSEDTTATVRKRKKFRA